MSQNERYDQPAFELKSVGTLRIEHVFYQLNMEPILFVCADKDAGLWLYSCCQYGTKWIVCPVSPDALLGLMDNETPIRDIFMAAPDENIAVTWDGCAFRESPGTDPSWYPQEGARLDLNPETPGIRTFREKLSHEEANPSR